MNTKRILTTVERAGSVERDHANGLDMQRGGGGTQRIAHEGDTGFGPGIAENLPAVSDICTQNHDCHIGGTRRPGTNDGRGIAAVYGDDGLAGAYGCASYDQAIEGIIAAICMILAAMVLVAVEVLR